MSTFIGLCSAFISGCAEFFNIPFPGLGGSITFFHVFIAFLTAHVILTTVKLVFGVPDSGSESDIGYHGRNGSYHLYSRGGNKKPFE